MNRKYIIFLIIMIFISLITGFIYMAQFSAFHDEGVHVLGNHAYIDIQQKCYFITADTTETKIQGSSTVTICGYLKDKHGTEAGMFCGVMGVPEYPIPIEISYHNFVGGIGDQYIQILNPGWELIGHAGYAEYSAYISRDAISVIIMTITPVDGETIVAVCGETEEEAKSNYQRYWDVFRGEG